MNIGNITSNNSNLDYNGKVMQIEFYEQLIEQLQQENQQQNQLLKDKGFIIDKLMEENRQLKDNWNKLKDYIVKEYYMYLPLEASTNSITILIDKMKELEGSDSK